MVAPGKGSRLSENGELFPAHPYCTTIRSPRLRHAGGTYGAGFTLLHLVEAARTRRVASIRK